MKFEIAVTDDYYDKVWAELKELERQLCPDMTVENGASSIANSIIVSLVDMNDTIALMKTLVDMANKGIHWSLKTEWWHNRVNWSLKPGWLYNHVNEDQKLWVKVSGIFS